MKRVVYRLKLELNHWVASLFGGWITSSPVECQATLMSYLSVSSCVTPMWIYGPAASSCVLISVADLDCTSKQECVLITYQRGSISHLTTVCLLRSDRLTRNSILCPLSPASATIPISLLTSAQTGKRKESAYVKWASFAIHNAP